MSRAELDVAYDNTSAVAESGAFSCRLDTSQPDVARQPNPN